MRKNNPIDDGGNNGKYTVKAVETAFTIIEALKRLDGATMTEIAEYTDFSKATVYKHLITLRQQDSVVKEGDTYYLGYRFLEIGAFVRKQRQKFENMIREKVRELADETGEIAMFMTKEHGRAIVIFREEGELGVSSKARLGKRFYMNQVAGGKAILAHLSENEVEEIIDQHGLPGGTENTITESEELHDELSEIKERGIAFTREESTEGVCAVSVPVILPDETILGACSISGPIHRLTGETFEEDIPNLLLSTVNEMELNMAYN